MAGHQGTSTRRDELELLAALVEAERREIHTTNVAEAVSYDAKRQKVTVQPRLTQVIDGETVRAPELQEVPVLHFRAGGFVFRLPVKKANELILLHATRSLEESGDDASDTDQASGRMHDLSDALALPASYSKPVELKRLPDGAYHGTEEGTNGLTISDAASSNDPAARKITLAAGVRPEEAHHELNEQLKGMAARLAQAEHHLHGLFDVTSRFREIVQQVIPAVAEVAPILNKQPSGLPIMAGAIESKAQAYLQQAVTQALAKFLSPNLAGLSSLLSAGLEQAIQAAKAELANLVAKNPVVGKLDDLQAQLADLTDPAAIRGLKREIAALVQTNPVLDRVGELRGMLEGMIGQAGPGLHFLEPQKRLVQGQTRSLRLGGA